MTAVLGTTGGAAGPGSPLRLQRDDGAVCRVLGGLARGQLPPLPGALVALAVTAVLLATGVGEQHGGALFAPAVVLLLTGPAAEHAHDGRFDWLVPPIVRSIEYGYLAVLGFAQGVPAPFTYVLLAVLAFHHHDVVYRARQGLRPPAWVSRAGLGGEGRMLVAAFAGLLGLLPFAYASLAVYLGVVFGGESVRTWARTPCGSGVTVDLEEEEA
ncbi:DUF5941 domain-containing protein [Actinomadura atramentaria]|uniref:DUF5941 domain-containing protein n=1 Tax=Actinomadura atramentaria TaxID=1990 RepID=UPI00039AEFAC|nr:DUF5941 domain-containing protein [Actinomadura atramentaria]